MSCCLTFGFFDVFINMGQLNINGFLNYKKIKDISYMINENQYREIYKLFRFYDTYSIKNRLTNIRNFILNGVDNKWLGRLYIIKNKLKNDIISEYSCRIRYGDNWELIQKSMKDKVKMDKDKFIKLYGQSEGIKKWEERNKKTISYGLNPAIKRYGEVEGKIRWESTLNKKINTTKERKKYKSYRNGRTLGEHQEKYGVESGYKIWKKKNENQSYRFSKNYYIDKYGVSGETMWEEYCDKMNKTAKKSFIKRYGEDEGTIKYENFVRDLKYKSSEEYYKSVWGDDIGSQKYKEIILSKIINFEKKYSKISQKLFWLIYDKLESKEKCYFYELNQEYTFYVWSNDLKIINVDFKIGDKIIEFDGDYWHSSEKQKKIDDRRDDFLESKGYKILRIKESEFKSDSGKVIEKCLNFIKR